MPVRPCDPRVLICPRCNRPMRRVFAMDGAFVARCENRILRRRDNGNLTAKPCGQHVHVLGTRDGVAFVVPISPEMFDALQRQQRDAGAIYRELGALDAGGADGE